MKKQKRRRFTDKETLIFMLILSFLAAFILSTMASVFSRPREDAKEVDRSREMLKAAMIYNGLGYFQIKYQDGTYIPAKALHNGELVPADVLIKPTDEEILAVYHARLRPMLVDKDGDIYTFAEAGIDEEDYIYTNMKRGYAKLPLKLVYEILPNPVSTQVPHRTKAQKLPPRPEGLDPSVEGYVIPVTGYGLWDYMNGYMAIEPDGDTVIGVSWYDQRETPGLGGNIAGMAWQSLFPGKKIFLPDSNGETDYEKATIGITVARGKVKDVLGNSPKARSTVDGMAGATITGNRVTKAYKESLSPYRAFFIKLHKTYMGESVGREKSEVNLERL